MRTYYKITAGTRDIYLTQYKIDYDQFESICLNSPKEFDSFTLTTIEYVDSDDTNPNTTELLTINRKFLEL